MKELYERIQGKSKNIKIFWMICISCCFMLQAFAAFPLRSDGTLFTVVLGSFFAGILLYPTLNGQDHKAIVMIMIITLLGFGLRVWIEWGEFSLMRDLTFVNVMRTYSPFIISGYTGYLYMRHCVIKS